MNSVGVLYQMLLQRLPKLKFQPSYICFPDTIFTVSQFLNRVLVQILSCAGTALCQVMLTCDSLWLLIYGECGVKRLTVLIPSTGYVYKQCA